MLAPVWSGGYVRSPISGSRRSQSADLRDQLQQSLTGSHVLERELAGGGMSRAFVATETAFGRKVVVKVLLPELGSGLSVARFRREIQLAARLQHPHIVGVLSAGEAFDVPYYTMPFVEGLSLRDRIKADGAMPIPETIDVLRDVAKALAYAHGRSVVHRDIKPDNVLISGGSAVVTDFGIAKAIAAALRGASSEDTASGNARDHRTDALTAFGTSIGTPTYMAPEQIAADPDIDHRADFYAFGVMAYELLTGTPPFHDRTPQRLLAAQMSETPEPVCARRTDTPPALGALVMRCLEKEPSLRPQNAAEIVRLLEEASRQTPLEVPAHLQGGPTLPQALALWTATFVAVVALWFGARVVIGVPDWLLPSLIAVMTVGLSAIILTHLVRRRARDVLAQSAITRGGSAGGSRDQLKFQVVTSGEPLMRRRWSS